MVNIFEGYQQSSKYLVCVDSDGCAMDTMDVKHIKCFAPQWIAVFGLQERADEAIKLWLDINLYTATRGINRFSGLSAACNIMAQRGIEIEDLNALTEWVQTAKELSNPALEAYLALHPSPCLAKALLWSQQVNRAIAALPDEAQPYPMVAEGLQQISAFADVVGISSANGAAVQEEWQKHNLRQYTRLLCCQEAGSKAEIIKRLLTFGYAPKNVLMVGDAFGDRDAAQANGIWFYPILTGKEQASWERLVSEALPRLVSETFDQALQDGYNNELQQTLQ